MVGWQCLNLSPGFPGLHRSCSQPNCHELETNSRHGSEKGGGDGSAALGMPPPEHRPQLLPGMQRNRKHRRGSPQLVTAASSGKAQQ